MQHIIIDTTDQALVASLQKDPPEGIKVHSVHRLLAAAYPSNSGTVEGDLIGVAIEFLASPVRDILIGLVSAWLYDKLKNAKSNNVTINRTEIYLTEGNINKIVQETFKEQK